MKTLATFLCALLALQISCSPVWAGTFSYTPAPTESIGTFKGQAPVNKVGQVYGSDLAVFINGPMMEVQQGDGSARKTIASGVVFKTQVKQTTKGNQLCGFWYCRSGDRQSDVLGKDAGHRDIVDTADGDRLIGTITSVDRDELTITDVNGKEHRVSTRQIEVRSPKVLAFSCFLKGVDSVDLTKSFQADVERISFNATFDKSLAKQSEKRQKQKVVSSGEGWSTKKKIIVFSLVGLAIATAIAVPIAVAVPVANHQRMVRNERRSATNAFLNSILNPSNSRQNQNRNQN